MNAPTPAQLRELAQAERQQGHTLDATTTHHYRTADLLDELAAQLSSAEPVPVTPSTPIDRPTLHALAHALAGAAVLPSPTAYTLDEVEAVGAALHALAATAPSGPALLYQAGALAVSAALHHARDAREQLHPYTGGERPAPLHLLARELDRSAAELERAGHHTDAATARRSAQQVRQHASDPQAAAGMHPDTIALHDLRTVAGRFLMVNWLAYGSPEHEHIRAVTPSAGRDNIGASWHALRAAVDPTYTPPAHLLEQLRPFATTEVDHD